jgi:rhodanese-related sulfurtransferase
MRKLITLVCLIVFAAPFAADAQYLPKKKETATTLQRTSADPKVGAARRISREEAIKLVRENKAVYVDVRSKDSFDRGHIKGALSFPGSQLLARIGELPTDKLVITYCACVAEHSAAVAVANLNGAGFRNSAALIGGWDDWIALGLPTEKTKK